MTMFRAFIMEVDMEEEKKEFTVDTPMGTIVAYASTDPLNPGIFVDLRREGYDFSLNLACIECNIDEDTKEPEALKLHAWTDAGQEDATVRARFENIDGYFDEWAEEGQAGG